MTTFSIRCGYGIHTTSNLCRLKVFFDIVEKSYTYIPKRLYVFQGSELAISAEMAADYVAARSQSDGSNGGDCPLSSEGSQSPSSSVGDEDESFVECVLRRCRHDSELEKERRRCVGEEVNENESDESAPKEDSQEAIEIINCDDSSHESIHEDLTTSTSLESRNDNGREAGKISCEPFNGTPPKPKRRRCGSKEKTAEEEDESERTKTIYISSSSLSDGKAVNV